MEGENHDAKVTLPTDDSEGRPRMQVEGLGGARVVTRIAPAPLFYNPKEGDAAVVLDIEGHSEDQEGICHNWTDRKKDALPGEGGLYNTLSGSFIHVKNNGDIEIFTAQDLVADITRNVIAEFIQMNLAGLAVNIDADVNITSGDTEVQQFGANGEPAQPKIVLPPDATNLATCITLTNAIKAALNTIGFTQ